MKQSICEALYALPGGVVEARRRPVVKPIAIAIVGIVLLTINFTAISDKAGALSMLLLVLGITLVVYGSIATIIRLVGSDRVPYDTLSRRYMGYRERYYDRALLPALKKALESGDIDTIEAIPTSNVSAITLIGYHTPDRLLSAYMIYEYIEFENRPLTKPTIIQKRQ